MRGLVLAGGKSTRFGSDKAVARYGGAHLLERAVSFLDDLSLQPIVALRPEAGYPFLKCEVIHDALPDRGPLGGLYTAMALFRRTPFLVLTCDMPAITLPILSELLACRDPRSLITAYEVREGQSHPFPAIYEPSLFDLVCEQLEEDDLSMRSLFESVSCKKLLPWVGEAVRFANINTPRELRRLAVSCGSIPPG